MIRLFGRSLLGVLVVLQSVGPVLASNWGLAEDSCGCAVEYTCCEPVVVECESCGDCVSDIATLEDCGCSATDQTEPTAETSAEPVPAETKQPEPTEVQKPTAALPQAETPAPTLSESETELPPAPIAVPDNAPSAAADTEELFPGPAPTDAVPAAEPATNPGANTEGLFDEPAAPVEEPPAETEVTEAEETPPTEDLFVEPSQPAADETEETETPTTEAETPEAETEEPAAESNPLDDLFGPSTPAEEPTPQKEESEEPESTDPFGRLELPTLDIAPSLAGSVFRSWSDFKANFRCEARLVRMTTTGVYLAKASGELVVIDLSQLSDADLNFVRDQIRAQRALLAPAHLAARPQ